MTLTGGKRKANKSLRAWVTFVKKVQKQEKLSYKDAIHRAKQRKDKGEKWMKGGDGEEEGMDVKEMDSPEEMEMEIDEYDEDVRTTTPEDGSIQGGRRRRRTMKRSRGSQRSRGSRRSRSSRRY